MMVALEISAYPLNHSACLSRRPLAWHCIAPWNKIKLRLQRWRKGDHYYLCLHYHHHPNHFYSQFHGGKAPITEMLREYLVMESNYTFGRPSFLKAIANHQPHRHGNTLSGDLNKKRIRLRKATVRSLSWLKVHMSSHLPGNSLLWSTQVTATFRMLFFASSIWHTFSAVNAIHRGLGNFTCNFPIL